MPDIIKIESLTKHFGSVVGVEDVSLTIEEGEFVTMLGPSGCGKSTLLRVIGGFEAPTRGRIFLDGEDVTDLPPHKRAVNMVFQDYALFPHMTVGRNIGYGLRIKGVPRAEITVQVREVLDLVGLTDKIDNMPNELSGGQRQRVALARAIVRRPKVLLLDEPLSALDANLREQMQVELKHLHEKVGLTFVMVTHDQTEALVMSDRVIVMRDGGISQTGAPADLYDRAANSYVANFIGTTNLFSSIVGDPCADGIRLECFGQPLLIAPDTRISAAGREQVFGFRPEKAVLHRGERPGNALSGRVSEVLYQGLGARIVVAVGTGTVVVDMLLAEAMQNAGLPSPGDPVSVEIAPHKVMAFEEGRLP